MTAERVWHVNLLPLARDAREGRWACYAPVPEPVFGGQVDHLIALAQERWPGRLLDVVSPEGNTYLVCAQPPWYPLPSRHP